MSESQPSNLMKLLKPDQNISDAHDNPLIMKQKLSCYYDVTMKTSINQIEGVIMIIFL